MTEPVWLKRVWLDAIHYQQLRRFGGLFDVLDEGTIDAALARPRNQWASLDDPRRTLIAGTNLFNYGPQIDY